ncbi:MAG TPA: hypothetical protein VFH24_04715 [Gemmatimonadales bacterium]|nr:hypothetical protein [Gemmatimonadales bacterium]
MRAWVWIVLGLVGAQPLRAQVVVQPESPLDSTRASLRDAVLVLRDSLVTIDAAAGRLQRDYREASGASLLSRARVMRDACARSVRTIPGTRSEILNAKLSSSKRLQARTELVSAIDTLKGVLTWCEKEFAAMSRPDQSETVRGYGNDRAVRVLGGLRRYEQSMRNFLALMGIRVTPLGVTPRSAAG